MHKRISGKRSGQTLIEVAVATIIAAITTVAVFSVILSGFVSEKKADKKELAAMVAKNAQQTLQAFVSVDPNDPSYSPNAGGRWSADTSGAWALNAGMHDISSLMNGTALQVNPAAPCSWGGTCYFVYSVTDTDCGFGNGTRACKTVAFSMVYAD